MQKFNIISLALLLMNLTSFGQGHLDGDERTWKSFSEYNYSIQYPDEVEIDTSRTMGLKFILLSKLGSEHDLFRENISFFIQDLTGMKLGLDEYVNISEEQVKTMITNGKIIESKRISIDTLQFHNIVYTGDQGQYNLKFQQRYWVINEKAYILTMTCEVNEYCKFLELGNQIMDTFRLRYE